MATYATEQEFNDWLTDRAIILNNDLPIAALLQRANDYIEMLNFKGLKLDPNQELSFPRVGLFVDGIEINGIPSKIKEAEMQLAYDIDQGFNPLATTDRKAIKEKLDVLEVEYKANSDSFELTAFNKLISPFLLANFSGYSR